jgi:hypothetical protein
LNAVSVEVGRSKSDLAADLLIPPSGLSMSKFENEEIIDTAGFQ